MSLSKLFGNPSLPGYNRIQYLIAGLSLGSFLVLGAFFQEVAVEIFLGMAMPLLIGLWTVKHITQIYLAEPSKVSQFMIKAFGVKMIIYGAYFVILFAFSTFNRWSFIISFLGFFSVLHTLEAVYFSYLLKQPQTK